MSAISYRGFSGEIPRLEPHLLPDTAAQFAQNCTFATGALTPLNTGSFVGSMLSNPIRGLYTEDGLLFYTWPVETIAFKSPFYNDTLNRMFYLQPSVGRFKAASTLELALNGPSPTQTWNVGVPQPTVAPVLTLVNRTTFPDYPSTSIVAEAWWTSLGVVYGKTGIGTAAVVPFKQYSFTVPTNAAVPVDEQANAVLSVRFAWRDAINNVDIASWTITGTETARSNGFPGTVEAHLSGVLTTGGAGAIEFAWGPTGTYSYTYVNENTWNEEGPAAPAAQISPSYVEDVQIVVAASDFTGFRPFLQYNIYRTFGTSTSYIKATVTGSFPTFTDSTNKAANMGAVLESADWFPPPSGLQGICQASNEYFAGFKGNTVHMSQPGRPHAWPYSQTFPTNVLGVIAGQQSIVVTTYDGVHLIVGSHPASSQQIKLALPQNGVAQRSMANIDGAVAFASRDGIPLVVGSEGTMKASQNIFDRKSWRAIYGDSIDDASLEMDYHDGFLVGNSRNRASGFIIRMDEDAGSFSRTTQQFDGMFPGQVVDALYYSFGTALYKYRAGGGVLEMNWIGKEFIMPVEMSFGAGFIRCAGVTELTVYADGAQVFQSNLTTGRFRLPGGFKALRWHVKLRGVYVVKELLIARSMHELSVI